MEQTMSHSEVQPVIAGVRQKWTEVALDERPTDRARAERAVHDLYAQWGRKPPSRVLWFGSPLALIMGVGMAHRAGDPQFEHLPDPPLHYMALKSSRTRIQETIETGKYDRRFVRPDWLLRHPVVGMVRRSILHLHGRPSGMISARASYESAIQTLSERYSGEQVRAMRKAGGRPMWWPMRGWSSEVFQGQYDAHQLAYFDYMRHIFDLEGETRMVQPLMAIAESASWMVATHDECWIAERHSMLRFDASSRLHHEKGPALAYPDGYAAFAWHGVMVPEKVIRQPDKITLLEINRMGNLEVRRVMIERYGETRFVETAGDLIAADECGELYRLKPDFAVGEEPNLMLKVWNSTLEPDGTRKTYILRVPPDIETARQAVAWTFNLNPETYQPLVET